MARFTALQLYKYLPKKNCKECGADTCMAFAVGLVDKSMNLKKCPYLDEKNTKLLNDIITPPVIEVEIGAERKIGGEEVLYRHEDKFYNETAIFLDISDDMNDDEIEKRIDMANTLGIERIGRILRLDGIFVRNKTGNDEKFKNVVKRVSEKYKGIITIATLKPDLMKECVKISIEHGKKPIIYAATDKNWFEFGLLAKEHDLAVVVLNKDLNTLGSISKALALNGVKKIILDPTTDPYGTGLLETLNRFTVLRKAAIKGTKEVGYPLMGSTAVIWDNAVDSDGKKTALFESLVASTLIDRFASMLVVHSTEIWAIMPLLYLKMNIYTDPKVKPTVEPKIYDIGKPDENSPVLVTTNYALTYFAVSGDAEGTNSRILVVDTEGLAVLVAVAAGKFNGSAIKKAIDETKLEEKVKHRTLILPGVAATIKGQVEDATGWKVMVGPRDSAGIGGFIKQYYQGDKQ